MTHSPDQPQDLGRSVRSLKTEGQKGVCAEEHKSLLEKSGNFLEGMIERTSPEQALQMSLGKTPAVQSDNFVPHDENGENGHGWKLATAKPLTHAKGSSEEGDALDRGLHSLAKQIVDGNEYLSGTGLGIDSDQPPRMGAMQNLISDLSLQFDHVRRELKACLLLEYKNLTRDLGDAPYASQRREQLLEELSKLDDAQCDRWADDGIRSIEQGLMFLKRAADRSKT